MKKKLTFLFFMVTILLTALLIISGCNLSGNGDGDGGDSTANYSKEYWGEWIRMDTGENWYISNNSIQIDDSIKSGVSIRKQSSKVIEVTEDGRKYYLFASRVNNARFNGSIANILPEYGRGIAPGTIA